jgi:hypothetical protein
MTFRKFGTSDEQRVLADEKDQQGVRKEASQAFTDKDREDLLRESSDWENEGGNGNSRR